MQPYSGVLSITSVGIGLEHVNLGSGSKTSQPRVKPLHVSLLFVFSRISEIF